MSGGNPNVPNSAAYTGMPVQQAPVLNVGGQFTVYWWRFFLNIWQRVASGLASDVTLGGIQQIANDTQAALDTTNNNLQAEVERATAAETALQTNINNVNTNLQGQINTINAQIDGFHVGGVGGVPAGTPTASLAVTINGVGYVLPLYP